VKNLVGEKKISASIGFTGNQEVYNPDIERLLAVSDSSRSPNTLLECYLAKGS
jgi:hypothetical protein